MMLLSPQQQLQMMQQIQLYAQQIALQQQQIQQMQAQQAAQQQAVQQVQQQQQQQVSQPQSQSPFGIPGLTTSAAGGAGLAGGPAGAGVAGLGIPPPPAVWQQYNSPDGKPYWHNSATGESTWNKPPGFP